ncbi:GH14754 [Drosophila grimshawi]|uniref:GH14754 n=1 Tax=Drosophila grimshawi TaxID=7222 RepID=B4IWS7_DROGR|nr:GH14754 [Drosophila grimshawi]
MMGAQSTSVAETAFEAKLSARQRADKRRRYGGRSAAAAGIHGHGRSSIGSVSAGIIKSFHDRFMSSAVSDASDYRVLRQRDAESGMTRLDLDSSGSSDVESLQGNISSSSSSVEDLFSNQTEREKLRRKLPERKTRRKRKVSDQRAVDPSISAAFRFRRYHTIYIHM